MAPSGCLGHGIRACDLCPTPGMTAGSCPRAYSLARDCCLLAALASCSSLAWAERLVCIVFMFIFLLLRETEHLELCFSHHLQHVPSWRGHWLPVPGASSVLLLGRAAEWSLGEVSWPINNTEICLGTAWREAPLYPRVSLHNRHVLGPSRWLAEPTSFSRLLWPSARQPLSCQKPCHTES